MGANSTSGSFSFAKNIKDLRVAMYKLFESIWPFCGAGA